MSLTSDNTPNDTDGGTVPPARVELTGPDVCAGLLDGAWWPRSRDLSRELPALIDVLDRRSGVITRVTVSREFWPRVPGTVTVAGRLVDVGWFREDHDPYELLLFSDPAGRWDLLVVPPQTGAAAATRLMSAASAPRGRLTAGRLVADEELNVAEADEAQEGDWESEGGSATLSAGGFGSPGRPRSERDSLSGTRAEQDSLSGTWER